MTTKIVKVGDSSGSVLVLILVLVALAVGGYVLYNQGYLGNKTTDININLPGGKTVSGSVSE